MARFQSIVVTSQGSVGNSQRNLAEDSQYQGVNAVDPDQAGGTPSGPSEGSGGGFFRNQEDFDFHKKDLNPQGGTGGWEHGRGSNSGFQPNNGAGSDTIGGGVIVIPSGTGTSSSFGSQSNADSKNSNSKNKAFRDELIRFLRQNYDMQGLQTKVIDVFVNAIQSLIDIYRMDPNNVVSKEIKRILESIFTNIQYTEELQKKLLEFIDSNPSGVDKKTVFSNSRPIRLDPPLVSQNSIDKDGNPYTLDILDYEVYWAYIDGQYELILKVSLRSRIHGTQPQVFTIRLKTGV